MSSNFNGSWGVPKTNTVPTDDSPMFGDYYYNIKIGGLNSPSEDSEDADAPEQVTLKSWSVVLVMIAMSILFIAWCAYATYTSYKSSASPNRPTNETGGEKRCKLSRKERTQLISEYLDREGNQTTIQEGDILPGVDPERGDTTESNRETILVVRKHVTNSSHYKGHGLDQETNEGVADDLPSSDTNACSRLSVTCHVHDACVICLDPYKVNDTVVWSSSTQSACPHVFHTDCFIEYLSCHRGLGVPCPSCRQAYFSEDIFKKDPCPSSAASLADSNSTARGHIGSGPSTEMNSDDIESGAQVDDNT